MLLKGGTLVLVHDGEVLFDLVSIRYKFRTNKYKLRTLNQWFEEIVILSASFKYLHCC